MKKLIVVGFLMVGVSACGLFGGGTKDDGGSNGGGSSLGTFHPGPYKDPTTGKQCNAPGGYCDDDQSCHSSADKCKAK